MLVFVQHHHTNLFSFILHWIFPGTKQAAESAQRIAREKELAKVSVTKEDIDLIVEELEISKATAERTLREHHGNVVEALAALTN